MNVNEPIAVNTMLVETARQMIEIAAQKEADAHAIRNEAARLMHIAQADWQAPRLAAADAETAAIAERFAPVQEAA